MRSRWPPEGTLELAVIRERRDVIIRCSQCNARFTIPDNKVVPGRRIKLKCSRCQTTFTHTFDVEEEAPEVAAPPPVVEPVAPVSAVEHTGAETEKSVVASPSAVDPVPSGAYTASLQPQLEQMQGVVSEFGQQIRKLDKIIRRLEKHAKRLMFVNG